jgi:hypothetical protein
VTILWRDIPAQVNAGAGTDRTQRILPRRFQKAIDRAAMVADKTQASEYVAEWRRLATTFDGDAESAAVSEAERLESEFPLERLNQFVAAGGWDPDRPAEEIIQADRESISGDPEESTS